MKSLRILAVSLLAAFAAVAQTTQTVNLSVTMSTPVLMDLHQHWLDQASPMGTITSSLDGTTASVQIVVSQSTLSQAEPVYKAGDTAMIGTVDTCAITATTGDAGSQTITCTRGQYALSPISAHDAGTAIYLLKFPTPWEMLVNESLRPYAAQLVNSLGPRSHTFGATISGSIAGQ